MDIRIEKTEKAIKNAFLELRAKSLWKRSQLRNCALLHVSINLHFTAITRIFLPCQS